MSSPPYRILMVCTGNVCRSPVMERLFVARVFAGLPPEDAVRFQVRSVGTNAVPGEPISEWAASALIALGGDPSDFASRALDAISPNEADLILTATRDQQDAVLRADPRVISRVLTLRNFARLLTGVSHHEIDARVTSRDPVERMMTIVAAALARRGLVPLGGSDSADIADPYGRRRKTYRNVTQLIDEALAVPLALLLPSGSPERGRRA